MPFGTNAVPWLGRKGTSAAPASSEARSPRRRLRAATWLADGGAAAARDPHTTPRDIEAIRREHCEAFVQDQFDRHSASTANTRYRGLQRFFGWAEEEGEIDASPMRRMRSPKFEERVRLGPVTLGDLAAGAARELEAGGGGDAAAQASVSRSSHVSG